MYTGMPNGRASTIPGPASRRCFGFSGVVLATYPRLRADEVVRVDARPRVTANVGALLYRCAVDELKVLAPGDDPPRPPAPPRSLSPSRAAGFMTCPLL